MALVESVKRAHPSTLNSESHLECGKISQCESTLHTSALKMRCVCVWSVQYTSVWFGTRHKKIRTVLIKHSPRCPKKLLQLQATSSKSGLNINQQGLNPYIRSPPLLIYWSALSEGLAHLKVISGKSQADRALAETAGATHSSWMLSRTMTRSAGSESIVTS